MCSGRLLTTTEDLCDVGAENFDPIMTPIWKNTADSCWASPWLSRARLCPIEVLRIELRRNDQTNIDTYAGSEEKIATFKFS